MNKHFENNRSVYTGNGESTMRDPNSPNPGEDFDGEAVELLERAERVSINTYDPDASIELASRAIRADDRMPNAYLLRGRLMIRAEKYEEALVDIGKAMDLLRKRNGNQSNVDAQLARVHYCTGNFEMSSRLFNESASEALLSNNQELRARVLNLRCLAWCALARKGKEAEANAALEKNLKEMRIEESQTTSDVFVAIAYFLARKHTREKFLANLQIMQKVDGYIINIAYFYLGVAEVNENHPENARQAFQYFLSSESFQNFEYQLAVAEVKKLPAPDPKLPPTTGKPGDSAMLQRGFRMEEGLLPVHLQ
jgi:tetratricopeptide (TPR) repeat protein